MSATMTMTLPPAHLPTGPTTPTTTTMTTACCPNCGLSLPSSSTSSSDSSSSALAQAQKQIDELQAQVRLLNQKASAAVDRWADYEDELSRLRAASTTSVATSTTHAHSHSHSHSVQSPNTNSIPASSPRSSFLPAGAASRISQLLAPRKSTPNLASAARNSLSISSASSPHPHPHPQLPLPLPSSNSNSNSNPNPGSNRTSHASTDDLLEALSREKEARARAEGRLNDTSKEVEELSATLFEQANEMVAAERRARARLEERVEVLERRDGEKRERLDRLEGAMGRIERVRALLGEK